MTSRIKQQKQACSIREQNNMRIDKTETRSVRGLLAGITPLEKICHRVHGLVCACRVKNFKGVPGARQLRIGHRLPGLLAPEFQPVANPQ